MHVICMWFVVHNCLNKYHGDLLEELSLLPEVIRDHFTHEATLELGFKAPLGVCKASEDWRVFPGREKCRCKCLKLQFGMFETWHIPSDRS